MEKKIFVRALVDIESVDEKLNNFLRAREEFQRAAYELELAVNTCTFQFKIKDSPLSDCDKAELAQKGGNY